MRVLYYRTYCIFCTETSNFSFQNFFIFDIRSKVTESQVHMASQVNWVERVGGKMFSVSKEN